METRDLLFELGTEELPPKALLMLAKNLSCSIENMLKQANLSFDNIQHFASPRRLAFIIKDLQQCQEDKQVNRIGPPIAAAYDSDGNPTKTALGFAKSCKVDLQELAEVETDKGKRLTYSSIQKGNDIAKLIPDMLNKSLKQLPIPKMMRWGNSDIQFVRPIHWVVLLNGNTIIPAIILGKRTSNISYGHRYHAPGKIIIPKAAEYISLLKDAQVLVDWNERKDLLIHQAKNIAKKLGATVLLDPDLVEEVNAIVETPNAICCDFSVDFLRVPQEALISSMQSHQKCFPLVDNNGKMINHFIAISNIHSANPGIVISGNEKVMSARLADAAFFYDTDLKTSLEDNLSKLNHVSFQKQLGSMRDKSQRIAKLAACIAKMLGENIDYAYRAGELSKTDLITEMVGEFPDLQGVMGRYYALAKNEPIEIADALDEQYMPRYSGDALPKKITSKIVSLADKIDSLVGIFGIGLKPTGDKDPFALRRSAISVIRILKENHLNLSLQELLSLAESGYKVPLQEDVVNVVLQFIYDRLKFIYKNEELTQGVFDAVLAVNPKTLADFDKRIQAVQHFSKLSAANNLAAANKRVSNLLTKNNINTNLKIDKTLLKVNVENELYLAIQNSADTTKNHINNNEYRLALENLASLEKPISNFFDKVMIMDEDLTFRNNRLALLQKIYQIFKQVADISKLSR